MFTYQDVVLSLRPGNIVCYFDYYIIMVNNMYYHSFPMITTGAISISQALMVNQTLLELHMEGNDIKDEGITAIAGSLSNCSITVLGVQRCGITFTGVRSLAAALSTNQNIRRLLLVGNLITVDGACLIMKSALDHGVCEYVGIDHEYKDDQVKEMRTILDDRRRQDVRNYVV